MAEGTKVIVGLHGFSAADVARQNGFVGDDAAWVASLQQGAADQAGNAGASAAAAGVSASAASVSAGAADASRAAAAASAASAASEVQLAVEDQTVRAENAVAAAESAAIDAAAAAGLVDAPAGDVVRTVLTSDMANPASALATSLSAKIVEGVAGKADADLLKLGVKRVSHLSGAQGSITGNLNTSAATGSGTIRWPFKLPVATKRWRLKLRNYNTVSQTPGAATTGVALAFGKSNVSTPYENGWFLGDTSKTFVSESFTIPTDTSFYVTPWQEEPVDQIPANREHLIALAFTSAPNTAIARGTGSCWYIADNTTTALRTGTVTPMSNTPYEFQIEYEFVGDQRVGVFVGDSITEGVGGMYDITAPGGGQPIYRAWPHLWAARSHCVAIDFAISGTQASQWTISTQDRWNRVDLTTTVPDFGYIGFGSNDANNSDTLATFKANFAAVLSIMRAKIGAEKPIYTATVAPRSFDATKEALRLSYNDWLRTQPYGIAGVLDFDAVLKNPADGATLRPDYRNSDLTHPSRAGYNAMALSVPYLAGL